jgi:hypothetical protein
MRLSIRGAKINSCIAPPNVCMGSGEREKVSEKWQNRERDGGKKMGRRERERESRRGMNGNNIMLNLILTAGCTSARQSSKSKISSGLHLSC